MSYPALPTPLETSPPNVPSDLGSVALAIETQGLEQYDGYNTTNTPSATSIETRLTAIDAMPGGTAAGLDTSITALNSSIATWTAPTGSNLATQAALTATSSSRQNGQDTTMATLTTNLGIYEPQITTLQQQRPLGLVYSSNNNYFQSYSGGSGTTNLITYATFTPRAHAYYRVTFTCSFVSSVAATNGQLLTLYVFGEPGTTPPTYGSTWGESSTSIPTTTSDFFPIGVVGIDASLSPVPTTVSVCFEIQSTTGTVGGAITGYGAFMVEDLGWSYL